MQFNPCSPKVGFFIGLIVLAFTLAVSTGYIQAQQPPGDTIDILFNPATCLVQFDWEDGTEDSERLEITLDSVRRPDVLINDVVGDASRILTEADITVAPGTHSVFVELFDGEVELDQEARTVVCEPPTTGQITIDKVVPGRDDIEDFVVVFDPGADVTIDDTDAPVTRTLEAGSYLLTEVAKDGWALVSFVCSSDHADGGQFSDTGVADRDQRINLRAGEHVTCVLTNEPIAPTATPVPPTATATPPPATATPSPTATQVPALPPTIVTVQAQSPLPPQIIDNTTTITIDGVAFPVTVPAAVVATAVAQQPVQSLPPGVSFSRISPPSTGDGGLLDTRCALYQAAIDASINPFVDAYYRAKMLAAGCP